MSDQTCAGTATGVVSLTASGGTGTGYQIAVCEHAFLFLSSILLTICSLMVEVGEPNGHILASTQEHMAFQFRIAKGVL